MNPHASAAFLVLLLMSGSVYAQAEAVTPLPPASAPEVSRPQPGQQPLRSLTEAVVPPAQPVRPPAEPVLPPMQPVKVPIEPVRPAPPLDQSQAR